MVAPESDTPAKRRLQEAVHTLCERYERSGDKGRDYPTAKNINAHLGRKGHTTTTTWRASPKCPDCWGLGVKLVRPPDDPRGQGAECPNCHADTGYYLRDSERDYNLPLDGYNYWCLSCGEFSNVKNLPERERCERCCYGRISVPMGGEALNGRETKWRQEVYEQRGWVDLELARYRWEPLPVLPHPESQAELAKHLTEAHTLAGYSDGQTHGNDHWRSTTPGDPSHTHPGWPGAPDFEG